MQLIQKAYTLADRGSPLAIRSAVCHDHLKGYFYVEADKESHVSGGGCRGDWMWDVGGSVWSLAGGLVCAAARFHTHNHNGLNASSVLNQPSSTNHQPPTNHPPPPQVLEAIKGLRTMFISKGAKLVPMKEMPDALTVRGWAVGTGAGSGLKDE